MKCSTAALDDPAIRRAKASAAKRFPAAARPKLFLRRKIVEKLLQLSTARPEWEPYGLLFLLAYVFLLRLPSEALPLAVGPAYGQSVVELSDDKLVLHLAKRKNKPLGSRLVRACWCKQSKETCPVHVLGPRLLAGGQGHTPFKGITPADALKVLRDMLHVLGIESAGSYRTHDFRRGHARDLQEAGVLSVSHQHPFYISWLPVPRLRSLGNPGRG